MAPRAPCSTLGPGTGAALEAVCQVSLFLEASRAPPPPSLDVVWHGVTPSRGGRIVRDPSVTSSDTYQIPFTRLLITRTCSYQSALLQIHASLRNSLSGLPFASLNCSQTPYSPTCVYLPFGLQSFVPLFSSEVSLVPGFHSPTILQRQTTISIQLRPIELTFYSFILTCHLLLTTCNHSCQ